MHENNLDSRRSELEQLSTETLDQMLQAELQKEDGDPAEVKRILAVLKAREKDMPVQIGSRERIALRKFEARINKDKDQSPKKRNWILRVACIAVIISVLLVTMSNEAVAGNFWERVARWTDSVFAFFSSDSPTEGMEAYEFQTEHPGLQQVYDAVAALGVTDPVVPMWIPEGYELIVCKTANAAKKATITAFFQNGEKAINFNVAVYSEDVTNQYQKDDTEAKVFDLHETKHYVVKNNTMWVAVWTMRNIECSISANCQEDELYNIIRSIYDKEETK